MKELNTGPIMGFVYNWKCSWKNHVIQMLYSRIQFQILRYQSKGRRSLGSPFRRWHQTV